MNIKVGMVSLGCPKNQVDAEIMLAKIKEAGFEITNDSGMADVVIVNTCGFIEDAKRESIENILEFCTLKDEGRIKKVVITGCLAQRYKEEVAKEIPEADVILGIGANDDIVEAIKKSFEGEKVIKFPEREALPLNGDRLITNLPFFAYLKIAEGCDNCCTYCAIPLIRGKFRSRPFEDIIKEAKYLAENGVTELVVVAQDTTRYGEDLYGKLRLAELLEELCKIDGVRWIRVLYGYPERITDELLEVMNREEKIVKYFDIPLQHASGNVLKAMNRRGDKKSLLAMVKKLREKVPGITLRTTLITGFPGETKKDFAELVEFVKEAEFERLGCFAYSQEEGTPAALLDNQIEEEEKKRRAEIVMLEQMRINDKQNKKMLGKTLEVVVEGYDKYAGCYFGRSRFDAPDIDTKMFFASSRPLRIGEYVNVIVEDIMEYDLVGSVKE